MYRLHGSFLDAYACIKMDERTNTAAARSGPRTGLRGVSHCTVSPACNRSHAQRDQQQEPALTFEPVGASRDPLDDTRSDR